MPLELSGVIDFFEGEMVDKVDVTRDSAFFEDDTWDEETGEYTPGAEDSIVVDQLGMVLFRQTEGAVEMEGDAPTVANDYTLWLPLSSPHLQRRDIVTIKFCMRDETLVGEEFWIAEPQKASTFMVGRSYKMNRFTKNRFS